MLQGFQSMRPYHNHSSRVTQLMTSHKYKWHVRCRTRVYRHGYHTLPTADYGRQFHSVGHTPSTRKHQFLDTWRTLPTVQLPYPSPDQVLLPGHPQYQIAAFRRKHVEGAEAAISLLTRDLFTTGKEDVLSHKISNEKWHTRAVLSMSTSVEECLHPDANFKVAQRCQHGIPYVVLMVFKAFLRRECGRGDRSVHRSPGSDE